MERYDEVKNSNLVLANELTGLFKENKSKKLNDGIQEYYLNLDISSLDCFNKVTSKQTEQLRNNGITSIKEMVDVINSGNFNIPNLGATKITYIVEALEKLKMEPNELFQYLVTVIKEHPEYDILIERAVNNNTLQQIGDVYGISRERIRQKEKKIMNVVEAVVNIFINLQSFSETRLLKVEELLDVGAIGDYEIKWLEYGLKNTESSMYKYFDVVDKFLVNADIDDIKESIKRLVKMLPDIVNIESELKYELYEYESLRIFSLDEMVNIVLTLGYKKVNNYLFRGNISKEKIYKFIVKEYFRDGITFSNDEDVARITKIAKEKFDLEEDSLRNVKAKIEMSCVLCDRGSYIHPDWVEVDDRLLEDIKDFIDNSSFDTLYTNQIYSQFENELINIGVKNRYYLHGILKYYFSDKYNFTKDTIYRGNVKHDRNYLFNNYIKEKGRIVTKEEMEEDLKGWTYIMLTMAADECKNVLKWDCGSMVHASLINLSLADINEIECEINNVFDGGIDSVIDNELFVRLSEKLGDTFKENNIDTGFKLFSLLECILSRKYYFRRPYILKDKPKEAVSATMLMKRLFNQNDKVTLEMLKDFCNDMKMNDSTRMQAINKLLGETIEIEKETYILKENFEMDDSDIEKVKNIILKMISKKGYLELNSITDFSGFPDMRFEWNSLILRDICQHYIPQVRELKKQFNDKRYPMPVMVDDNSEFKELLDLLIHIIKTDFSVNEAVGIVEFTEYLKSNNIIYDKIPFEVYNCDELLIDNDKIVIR